MKTVTHLQLVGSPRLWAGLVALVVAGAGCGGSTSAKSRGTSDSQQNGPPGGSNTQPGPAGTGGSGGGSGAAPGGAAGSSMSQPAPGSFGNVGVSGGQDFAAFRRALEGGKIPARDSIEATGFFAEHFTSLPAPTCGRAFCLHGMISVSKDLTRGGPLTLLQMGMNSTIDPTMVKKPPLNLAVVLDHSGSMAAAGKMEFAKEGVKLLIDALGPEDTFTLVIFDDKVQTVFGPGRVSDKEGLKGRVGEIGPAGGTNIFDGLEAGYRAVLGAPNENEQRRVIFLTDGLPTAGNTDAGAIRNMSVSYNQRYVGLTTIGLGTDVNIGLLRGLAESGGGNFYFIEKPAAVREVFMEELSFFVAPIAYDLELTFSELPGYTLKSIHGTALWQQVAGGGKVSVPSVFLVSRTSSDPGPNGGRRGGGSAILAELSHATAVVPGNMESLGKLTLKYRIPGQTAFEVQEAPVSYVPPMATATGAPAPEVPDFYSNNSVEKNTLILNFFFAFRDATALAQTDPRKALDLLTAFQPRITQRLVEWKDEDLLDDLKILQKYIDVLKLATGSRG